MSFIYRFYLLLPLYSLPKAIVEPGENRLYLLSKVIYLFYSISKKEYYYKEEKIYLITTIKINQYNSLFLLHSLKRISKFILSHKVLFIFQFRDNFDHD